jgi:hypothetical protein
MKKSITINKNLILNNRYKDFYEILQENLEKMNNWLKIWKYYLDIKDNYFWLYFKKYPDWIIYQSLAFFNDLSIYYRIKWNINQKQNENINI